MTAMLKCFECGRFFKTIWGLKRHWAIFHPVETAIL